MSNTNNQAKVLSLLGFSARARKIVCGFEGVSIAIKKGKASLVILPTDLAENSRKKVEFLAEQCGVQLRTYLTSDEISHIVGKPGKAIFALTDKGFGESIKKLIDEDESK